MLLLPFYLILVKSLIYDLGIDSVYIKIVGYNLSVTYHRHIYNCWLKKIPVARAQSVSIFIISFSSGFHVSSFNGSLLICNKPKANENFWYFTFNSNIILTKISFEAVLSYITTEA
jgi:hypothetical protein